MNNILEKRIIVILVAVVLVLCIAIGIPVGISHCLVTTSNYDVVETTEPTTESATEPTETALQAETETVKVNTKAKAKTNLDDEKLENTQPTETKETKPSETEEVTFATAATGTAKISYTTQWNQGYIVAVDYPDTSYSCPHIELTDENRDLVERLCMGEFGSGGFNGAALIAQAVKNAMATYGYTNVKDVITNLHYTGSTNKKPTKAVKDAVVYIFDMDKDAVQHRILYMYNPKKVSSKFHESQRYICTYKDVRFFDK
ncbi:MAG: hypothetical protein ACI4Q8_06765 [Ruminococcus sp.]